MENATQRSPLSDSFATLLLAVGVVLISGVLHLFAEKEVTVLDLFYPEEFELPALTQLILKIPFLAIGTLASVAIAVFAVACRRRGWVQRHLTLIVSAGWSALGLYTAVSLLGLVMPMVTATTYLNSP